MESTYSKKLAAAMWGAILGDALGTLFNGMSKAHVRAVFKTISNFIDPMPALKGKEHRWKKPGLYTAPSQMMLLLGIISPLRNKAVRIQSIVAQASIVAEFEWGIFRHPDPLLSDFIKRCRIAQDETFPNSHQTSMMHPSIFTSFLASPLQMRHNLIRICTEYARFFTIDEWTLSYVAIMMQIVHQLIQEEVNQKNLVEFIIDTAKSTAYWFIEHPAELFSMRLNPESFCQKLRECVAAFEILKSVQTIEEAEQKICAHAASHFPNPITRASIAHPLLIVPYACSHFCFANTHSNHPIFNAAVEGGSSGLLASMVGLLVGAHAGFPDIPSTLKENLINKNEIERIINALCENHLSTLQIESFINSEMKLTKKEIEERNARLKHIKHKEKKKKPSPSSDEKLTKIVVESWTKLDKAKWKKQKKKLYGE